MEDLLAGFAILFIALLITGILFGFSTGFFERQIRNRQKYQETLAKQQTERQRLENERLHLQNEQLRLQVEAERLKQQNQQPKEAFEQPCFMEMEMQQSYDRSYWRKDKE